MTGRFLRVWHRREYVGQAQVDQHRKDIGLVREYGWESDKGPVGKIIARREREGARAQKRNEFANISALGPTDHRPGTLDIS